MPEIKNVSDVTRELVLGAKTIVVEPGDCVTVSDTVAEQLLEQPDNWGQPSECTLTELLEKHVGEVEDGETHELYGLTRTEILTATEPKPATPSTVADYTAALQDAGVEIPADAKKADLVALYDEHINPSGAAGENSEG